MNLENQETHNNSEIKFPYKLFVSHKVSEHGKAASKLKRILNRDGSLEEKVKIYVSSEVAPGENWRRKFYKELDEADLLLYIYLFNTPPTINDYCNFETGYYAKKSERTNLISIVPPGKKPPETLREYQYVELTPDGIQSFLRKFYEETGIWKKLFDTESKDTLNSMIESIIKLFKVAGKPIALSPRIWITLDKNQVNEIQNENKSISLDAIITGETEAANRFGYKSEEGESISLKKLIEKAEYKASLPLFFNVLTATLKKILDGKKGTWVVPPVRVFHNLSPNILVPAYKKNLPDGSIKFEFIVTSPQNEFSFPYDKKYFMELYDLFTVAWNFRWQIIERYYEEFVRFSGVPKEIILEEVVAKIRKLQTDLDSVYLDSFNRTVQYPHDVLKNFEGDDEKEINKIIAPIDGDWAKIQDPLKEACANYDSEKIIILLDKMRKMNKTYLAICTKYLKKIIDNQL